MPTISVITPTFNREDLLQRCVESTLKQQVAADVEHFVVNDFGKPLGQASWMDDPRVTVLNTYRTERSVARNTGAALSRGDWLYFLDDDDYALPGAFAAMLKTAEQTRADHIYGGYAITGETSLESHTLTPSVPTEAFSRLLAGETLPPQATWLRRDAFFRAGGFDPLMVPVEDVDLFRRVGLKGTTAGMSHIVAHIRVDHPETTTTTHEAQRRAGDLSLEGILASPEAFKIVLAQTATEPYWRGRCARVYCGSVARNLRSGRRMTAMSRLSAGLMLIATAKGKRGDFRRGFLKSPGSG